jgi:hypothetical protein
MIVIFDKSFSKSLDKINDPSILKRIESVILKLEKAESLRECQTPKNWGVSLLLSCKNR